MAIVSLNDGCKVWIILTVRISSYLFIFLEMTMSVQHHSNKYLETWSNPAIDMTYLQLGDSDTVLSLEKSYCHQKVRAGFEKMARL